MRCFLSCHFWINLTKETVASNHGESHPEVKWIGLRTASLGGYKWSYPYRRWRGQRSDAGDTAAEKCLRGKSECNLCLKWSGVFPPETVNMLIYHLYWTFSFLKRYRLTLQSRLIRVWAHLYRYVSWFSPTSFMTQSGVVNLQERSTKPSRRALLNISCGNMSEKSAAGPLASNNKNLTLCRKPSGNICWAN